jgi:hypothetical protein
VLHELALPHSRWKEQLTFMVKSIAMLMGRGTVSLFFLKQVVKHTIGELSGTSNHLFLTQIAILSEQRVSCAPQPMREE